MASSMRRSGIPPVGDVPWGSHFCQFFETTQDHFDAVVPYFAAGREQHELCFWLVWEPVTPEQAIDALRRVIPNVDDDLASGAVIVQAAPPWYLREGVFDIAALDAAWDALLASALERGFEGLRVAGCNTWLQENLWGDFCRYEQDQQRAVMGKRMLVLCSYPLASASASEILDVAQTHQFVLAKRGGEWNVVETPALRMQQLDARSRQQAAIADLGRTAIRERDFNAIFRRVAVCSAETLGTGRSIVWQLRPERNDLVVCAKYGWDDLPADSILPVEPNAAAAWALRNDEPLVVADVATDSRFLPSWILRGYGVRTMITTVIRGPSEPWGLLSVHSLTPRTFSDDDVEFLQSMANVLALAIDRNAHEEAERQIAENIDEAFWVATADLERLIYANPAAERLTGRPFASVQGPRGWLEPVHPDDRQRFWDMVTGRAPFDHDGFRVVRPDGTMRWADARITAIHDNHGNVVRVCGITHDITERKLAEEERARLLASTEAALAKLRAIESITDAALGHMSLDELLHELLSRLRATVEADYTAVLMFDDQRTGLTMRAIEGFPASRLVGVRIPLTTPISGPVLSAARPLILNDLPASTDPAWQNWTRALGVELRSAMGAPLTVEGKVIGTIVAASLVKGRFTEDQLDLLGVVADRVAPAIERTRLTEVIRAGHERLGSLSRRLLKAQEDERRRLAIELHDELGQILTAAKINLERDPPQLRDAVESVDRAMRSVRDLALDLRPAMLDDLGLAAALRWYADRFATQTRLQMHLGIDEVTRLDPAIATASFRVAQEALTNVARHAAAKNVWLELRRSNGSLELVVRDDGAGFDVDAAYGSATRGASMGVLGMNERVSLVGGSIDVRSASGKGTEIRARFPIGGEA